VLDGQHKRGHDHPRKRAAVDKDEEDVDAEARRQAEARTRHEVQARGKSHSDGPRWVKGVGGKPRLPLAPNPGGASGLGCWPAMGTPPAGQFEIFMIISNAF
jgi:hypothetical protein